MYIVYVLIQKGPIDFTKQLVPTRVHRCSSIEEAFEKKRQEEESLFMKELDIATRAPLEVQCGDLV